VPVYARKEEMVSLNLMPENLVKWLFSSLRLTEKIGEAEIAPVLLMFEG